MKIGFVRDVATLQIGVLVGFVCSFISSILYVRFLGIEGYGRYAIVMAFSGLFAFITNLGQQQTTLTFFSEAYAQKSKAGMATALRYYMIMTFMNWAVHIALLFLYPLLSQWIYGDPELGNLARLISIASMIDPIANFFLLSLQTVRRIKLLTVLQYSQNILQVSCAALFLWYGYGIAGVLWSSIIGSVALLSVAVVLWPKMRRNEGLPGISEAWEQPTDKRLWAHFRDGIWIAVDKNLGKQYPGVFLFLLSLFAPTTVVGLVRLAFRLADLPTTFGIGSVSALATSVIPQIVGGHTPNWRQTLRRLFTHSMALHAALSFGALLIAPPLIPIVYGTAARVAVYPFIVIVLVHLIVPTQAMITPYLRLRSRVWVGTIFNTVATLGGMGVFLLGNSFFGRITFALYAGLVFYHVINAFVMIPVWQMWKREA